MGCDKTNVYLLQKLIIKMSRNFVFINYHYMVDSGSSITMGVYFTRFRRTSLHKPVTPPVPGPVAIQSTSKNICLSKQTRNL